MALTMITVAGIAGSMVLLEGLYALVEHMVGDPEADVEMALRNLASKNQRRAMHQLGAQGRYEDMMAAQHGNPMNQVFERGLTSAAMNTGGGPFLQESQGDLLRSIEARLGVQPGQLASMSSPERAGDMSSIYHAAGRQPPKSTSPPPPQVGSRTRKAAGGPPPGGQPQPGSPQ